MTSKHISVLGLTLMLSLMALGMAYAPTASANLCVHVGEGGEISNWKNSSGAGVCEMAQKGAFGGYTRTTDANLMVGTVLNNGQYVCAKVAAGEWDAYQNNMCGMAANAMEMNQYTKFLPFFIRPPANNNIAGAGGKQVFTVSGGTAECASVKLEGKDSSVKAEEEGAIESTFAAAVKYSSCKAFGVAAEVSEGEYEFNAAKLLTVLHGVTITIKSAACHITIGPASNKTLYTIKYTNTAKDLVEAAEVKNVAYTSSGGSCGASGTNGLYTGSAKIEFSGGAVEWY